jgi:hypothetical protein
MEYTHSQQELSMDLDSAEHAPASCHGDKAADYACASRRPETAPYLAAPVLAAGTPLPKGCAVGIPVYAGIPAVALPVGKGFFRVAMTFVETDDYHSLVELARCGKGSVDFKRKCGFTVAMRPEVGSMGESFPSQLKVRSANLLHYAICIGSFRAATALLVLCPELLLGQCTVSMNSAEQGEDDTELWGSSELARIFCVLYAEQNEAEVSATGARYNKALQVLELGEHSLSSLPFLGLPTAAERIAAAGCDADTAIAALFGAASGAPAALDGDTRDDSMNL